MKTTATLKIEFMCGDEIEGAFEEAIRIATQLNVWVEFDFNGVTCVSGPDSSVAKGVSEYAVAMTKGKLMMAFS